MDTEKIYAADGSNNFANGALMGASLNKGNNDPALMAAMMNGGMGGQNRINSLESQLALSQQTQTILDRLNSSSSAARTATSAQ